MYATAKPLELHLLGYAIPLTPRRLVRAGVAEVKSMPIALQAWFGFLLAILAVAVVAAAVSIPPGWEVFGTTPSFEWGLMIIGYVVFAIMTSGLCLSSSLGTVFGIERFRPFEKRHAILAILSLLTAFLIIALDLHYPVRMVFGAMLVPSPSSPMWWMGVFYGAYLVVLIVEVWSMFTDHPKIHQYACTIASVIAILAPSTLGAVFGVLGAKAYWNGVFTPIGMVITAFLSGTALLGIVFYLVHRLKLADWRSAASVALPSVRILMAVALVAVSALLIRQVVAGLDGDVRGLREATVALVAGPLAWLFWGRVLGGLVIPALLIAAPLARSRPEMTFAASILVIAGVFLDRYLFVVTGQIAPITAGAGTVSYPYAHYLPSPAELAIIAGACAFMALGYTLAERYLDMGEGDTHVFFPFPWIKQHADHDHDAAHADHEHGAADHDHEDLAPAAATAIPEVLGGPVPTARLQGMES